MRLKGKNPISQLALLAVVGGQEFSDLKFIGKKLLQTVFMHISQKKWQQRKVFCRMTWTDEQSRMFEKCKTCSAFSTNIKTEKTDEDCWLNRVRDFKLTLLITYGNTKMFPFWWHIPQASAGNDLWLNVLVYQKRTTLWFFKKLDCTHWSTQKNRK